MQKAIDEIDAEIIVVDNHSSDDSVNYLHPLFPAVRFLANQTNIGFAKANNQALAICQGEYVLFLNPDTLVPDDCFKKCLSFLKANANTGALGVRMLDGKGKFLPESKRSFPSPWVSFFKLAGLSALFPHSGFFNRYALGNLDEYCNHSVEVLAGACMFVKKELLIQLNGFDETYFLYGEDIDLSYRIKNTGAQNWYFAETAIIHFKGESSGNTGLSRVKFFYQAMRVFVQKYYQTGAGKLLAFFLRFAIAVRGALSAIHRLLKPVRLPLTDILLVWFSLQAMRLLWIQQLRNGKDFGIAFIWFALPAFALWFVLSLAFAGLYDRRYKMSKSLLSIGFAVISMLAVYSLLPETMRFSRGVIVYGGVLGGILILLTRKLMRLLKCAAFVTSEDADGQTIIVATQNEYETILQQLETVATNQQVLGRIEPKKTDPNALCTLTGIQLLEKNFTISTIIFCVGYTSLKEIMQQLPLLAKMNARFLFHFSGSNSMVGSMALSNGAAIVTPFIDFRITHAYQRRMKRVVDVLLSLFFIGTIPIHIIIHPERIRFIRDMFRVLAGSNTWVGYAMQDASLPAIRKGIVSSLGQTNTVNEVLLKKADTIYAKNYDWWQDIQIVFQNYRQL